MTETPNDRSSPRRPLYQSPTKSSLSKHAPHLIRQSPARTIPQKRRLDSGYESLRPNGMRPSEAARGGLREKRRAPILFEEEDEDMEGDESVRAVVEKMRGLRREIQSLEDQVRRERERIEREGDRGEEREEGEVVDNDMDVEALMNSLLASNDSTLAAHTKAVSDRKKSQSAIPSARPVRLDDPLPSLRAFSAITYTRLETLALGRLDPNADDEDPDMREKSGIIREDRMSGYSGDRELFFRLRMRVDTRVHSVTELDAEISAWARRELGPHLDTCIQACNISSLLTSISSFTKQANARSKVFALLTRLRPDLVSSAPPGAQPKALNSPLTTSEILQHQGRTLLRLRPVPAQQNRDRRSGPSMRVLGGLELVLSWEISLDALGEAKSRVRMGARWSDKWGGEGKDVLDQVEGMFDKLLNRKGVLGAATGVMTLVFPQAASP